MLPIPANVRRVMAEVEARGIHASYSPPRVTRYRRKLPKTAADHERIRLAEAKRARKGARLLRIKAVGGIK